MKSRNGHVTKQHLNNNLTKPRLI